MVANTWKVLSRAVEEGVGYGVKRAYKHTDHPSQEAIENAVYNAVLGEIGDVFEFPDYPDAG